MGIKKIVLVIDDDQDIRDGVASGLRAHDFDVVTADSAEAGAQILKRLAPDAIVLDRMMTGMDGLGALIEWRAHGDGTPVIMLTAMTGPENTVAGLAGGADDYLAKPFSLKELVLRLHNITRHRPVPAAAMPVGLTRVDGEFFAGRGMDTVPLALSPAEKALLGALTTPVGAIATGAPMVAKRLREKLKSAADLDIITVRGRGYKLVTRNQKSEIRNQESVKE